MMFCIRKEATVDSVVTFGRWWYNSTYHEATKMEPYDVVYDQQPPVISQDLKELVAIKTPR